MGKVLKCFSLVLLFVGVAVGANIGNKTEEIKESDGVIFTEPPIHVDPTTPTPLPSNSSLPIHLNNSSTTTTTMKPKEETISATTEKSHSAPANAPAPSKVNKPPKKVGGVPPSFQKYIEEMHKSANLYAKRQAPPTTTTTSTTTTSTTTTTTTTEAPKQNVSAFPALPPPSVLANIIQQLEKQKQELPKIHLIPQTQKQGGVAPPSPSVKTKRSWLWDMFGWNKPQRLPPPPPKEVPTTPPPVLEKEFRPKTILRALKHPLPGMGFYECPYEEVQVVKPQKSRSFLSSLFPFRNFV